MEEAACDVQSKDRNALTKDLLSRTDLSANDKYLALISELKNTITWMNKIWNKTSGQRVAVFSQYSDILHRFEIFRHASNETFKICNA